MSAEGLSEQLRQACEAYQKARGKYNLLLMELEKLSLKRLDEEYENWTNKPVPTEISELKFLDNFDCQYGGKERLVCH